MSTAHFSSNRRKKESRNRPRDSAPPDLFSLNFFPIRSPAISNSGMKRKRKKKEHDLSRSPLARDGARSKRNFFSCDDDGDDDDGRSGARTKSEIRNYRGFPSVVSDRARGEKARDTSSWLILGRVAAATSTTGRSRIGCLTRAVSFRFGGGRWRLLRWSRAVWLRCIFEAAAPSHHRDHPG